MGDEIEILFEFEKKASNSEDLLERSQIDDETEKGLCELTCPRRARLGFEQIDDYYGIPATSENGDDVIVWLFPVVAGEVVTHSEGPFDGVRLVFNVLRNTPENSILFLRCFSHFFNISKSINYNGNDISKQKSDAIRTVEFDISEITSYWKNKGIIVGSEKALLI
jgi:hypothetical protein